MKIAILRTELGTPKHLIHDGEKFVWSAQIPESAWVYPEMRGYKSFESVLKALSVEVPGFRKTPHAVAWSSILNGKKANIPWMHALSPSLFQDIVQSTLEQLWLVLNRESDGYYMNEFVINR